MVRIHPIAPDFGKKSTARLIFRINIWNFKKLRSIWVSDRRIKRSFLKNENYVWFLQKRSSLPRLQSFPYLCNLLTYLNFCHELRLIQRSILDILLKPKHRKHAIRNGSKSHRNFRNPRDIHLQLLFKDSDIFFKNFLNQDLSINGYWDIGRYEKDVRDFLIISKFCKILFLQIFLD